VDVIGGAGMGEADVGACVVVDDEGEQLLVPTLTSDAEEVRKETHQFIHDSE